MTVRDKTDVQFEHKFNGIPQQPTTHQVGKHSPKGQKVENFQHIKRCYKHNIQNGTVKATGQPGNLRTQFVNITTTRKVKVSGLRR